jgi:hypothetical protein
MQEPGMVTHTCTSNYWGGGETRILVQGQAQQKLAIPYLKNKLDMVAQACNPSYFRGIGKSILVQGYPGQKAQDPIWKTKAKRVRGVAQMEEHLPSNCEALHSEK